MNLIKSFMWGGLVFALATFIVLFPMTRQKSYPEKYIHKVDVYEKTIQLPPIVKVVEAEKKEIEDPETGKLQTVYDSGDVPIDNIEYLEGTQSCVFNLTTEHFTFSNDLKVKKITVRERTVETIVKDPVIKPIGMVVGARFMKAKGSTSYGLSGGIFIYEKVKVDLELILQEIDRQFLFQTGIGVDYFF